MKQMRDTAEEFFMNRGKLQHVKNDPVRRSNSDPKQENELQEKKPRETLKCFNCDKMGHFANECPVPKNPRCLKCKKNHKSNESCKLPEANVRRLGAENRDKWFTKKIIVQSQPYIALIRVVKRVSFVKQWLKVSMLFDASDLSR